MFFHWSFNGVDHSGDRWQPCGTHWEAEQWLELWKRSFESQHKRAGKESVLTSQKCVDWIRQDFSFWLGPWVNNRVCSCLSSCIFRVSVNRSRKVSDSLITAGKTCGSIAEETQDTQHVPSVKERLKAVLKCLPRRLGRGSDWGVRWSISRWLLQRVAQGRVHVFSKRDPLSCGSFWWLSEWFTKHYKKAQESWESSSTLIPQNTPIFSPYSQEVSAEIQMSNVWNRGLRVWI